MIITFFSGNDIKSNVYLCKKLSIEKCFMFEERFGNSLIKHIVDEVEVISVPRYLKIENNQKTCNFEFVNLLKLYEFEIYNLIIRDKIHFSGELSYSKLRTIYFSLLRFAESFICSDIEYIILTYIPHKPLEFIVVTLLKLMGVKIIYTIRLPFTHVNLLESVTLISKDFPLLDNRYSDGLKKLELIPDLLSLSHEFYNYFSEYGNSILLEYNNIHHGNRKRVKREIFKNLYYYNYQKASLKKFYYANSSEMTISDKFYYFPLHYQPEATTNPMGGIFVDQLFVVRIISSLLPSGINLYVREHPATWNRVAYEHSYNRSIDFYREILSYKNVKLINYKNHPYELIRNSIAVVTITGTVAFEAFGMNKQAIVFGNHFYNQMFNAIKPKSIEELRSFIEKEKITNLQAEFLKNLFVMESLSVRGDIKDTKYKYKIIDEIVNIMLDININN